MDLWSRLSTAYVRLPMEDKEVEEGERLREVWMWWSKDGGVGACVGVGPRKFRNGRATERSVEFPMSLIFRPATSARSAPLVDQRAIIARHFPEGLVGLTIQSTEASIMRRVSAGAERLGPLARRAGAQLALPYA
ncbi:hypothetical protein CALVIDRAFT_554743 [Calocera viscosa TUFC12733]|uniref:Uncharacterized protein n=1 Tax=Calocera viscosa (strain TUFC12733) TaxID=1330018 RepID=A0A167MWJ1_CALVF|nr:hypothetical protein CALVIDRAFT_554743 [Calocera viscosa TUFC12733]